jgi:hypothetical protein
MPNGSCTLIVALALLACAPAEAQGRRGGAAIGLHHGHHGHHGHWRSGFWGGIGLGIGLWPYYGGYYGYGPVIVGPPALAPDPRDAVASAAPSAPDPVFVAPSGQDAARTESDRQACNRWVATQSAALRDAQVFHRMSLACMEGRGYSVQQAVR